MAQNSYDRLKARYLKEILKNEELKKDIRELVRNPNGYRSMEIQATTRMEIDLEACVWAGYYDIEWC